MKMKFVKPANFIKLSGLAFAVAMVIGLYSCEQYEILPEEIVEEVTFTDVQAIFNKSCVGCHDGVTATPVLEEGVAYNNLINGSYINTEVPEESLLYTKIKSSDHSLYSSSSDRSSILNWIENGALNN